MKSILILLFTSMAVPAFAASPFDQFLGTYSIVKQECSENHVPVPRGCDKISIALRNDGKNFYVFETNSTGSSGYPLEVTQYDDGENSISSTIDGDANHATWNYVKSIQHDASGNIDYLNQTRTFKRDGTNVIYTFTDFESTPGLPDGSMIRTYTLQAK